MKIIYLNKELDPTKEHELFSDNFGFNITIKYTEESWYPDKVVNVYNCTEFHWRYNQSYDWVSDNDKDVAFESDIHSTGFTRKINTIESVTITLADKLCDEYRD